MESKTRKLCSKYDNAPFNSHLFAQRNSRHYAIAGDVNWRYGRRTNQLVKHEGNNAGGLIPNTKSKKPYLQKVDTDTFRLLPEVNASPKVTRDNASTDIPQSSTCFNRPNGGGVCFHATKTPQCQMLARPEDKDSSQTLINRRKALHETITFSEPVPLKGFISVSGEQMTRYLQVIGIHWQCLFTTHIRSSQSY